MGLEILGTFGGVLLLMTSVFGSLEAWLESGWFFGGGGVSPTRVDEAVPEAGRRLDYAG